MDTAKWNLLCEVQHSLIYTRSFIPTPPNDHSPEQFRQQIGCKLHVGRPPVLDHHFSISYTLVHSNSPCSIESFYAQMKVANFNFTATPFSIFTYFQECLSRSEPPAVPKLKNDSLSLDMHPKTVYLRSRRTTSNFNGHHPALTVNTSGIVKANCPGDAGKHEALTLHSVELSSEESSLGLVVALQTSTGKFLSATSEGFVTAAIANEVGQSEKWVIVKGPESTVALKSAQSGKFLCCDGLWYPGSRVVANRDVAKKWEHWWFVELPITFSVKGCNAGFVCCQLMKFVGQSVFFGGLAIPLCGFSTGGVLAGSPAAYIQKVCYGGRTTGIFSVLQSAGATMRWIPYMCSGGMISAAGFSGLACSGDQSQTKAAHSTN